MSETVQGLKVIFVIVSMAGGGAERVISILANQFIKKGMEVTILMTAGEEVAYELDPGIEVVSAGGVSGKRMRARLERIRRMRRVFRDRKGAVVVSFGPGTSFFAVAADMFLHHRFLISERNDPGACPHPKLRNLVYARAKRLIFQTGDAMDCFPPYLRGRGAVISNPIKEDIPMPYTGERKKRVVAVGRLEKQKNYPLLLRAFAGFHKKFPEYSLHIYGNGSLMEELKQTAGNLEIGSDVIFEGFTRNVQEKIQDGGMYILPSDYEGISNALLEAMAMGLPVIATDCPIGGAKMCIRHGENGILVGTGNEEELRLAMEKLACDPEYAAGLGKKAAAIRSLYSEESISDQWIEMIKDVLA